MDKKSPGKASTQADLDSWKKRCEEADEILGAITRGEVDSLVVNVSGKPRVYALKGANEEYRVMVENMDEGAAILNSGGIIIYCNKRFSKILMNPPEKVLGLKFGDFLDKKGEALLSKLLRAKTNGTRQEMGLVAADGTSVPVYASAVPMPGRKRQIILMVSDMSQLARATEYITEQKKVQEDITRLNRQLEDSLKEKEVLLKELYHRTKNNMNVLSGLMTLQMNAIKDQQTKQLFKEAQGRIQSMALVHEMLYKTRELSKLDLKDYLERLARSVITSYSAKNVNLKLDLDSAPVSLYIATPCGLILNELLTNSIKHAFPNGRGEITLSLKADGSKIELACSDNGIGFPKGFDIERAKSLGLKLVDGLVRKQLMGSLEISGEKAGLSKKGAGVVIRFDTVPLEGRKS